MEKKLESDYALQNWVSGGSVVFVIRCYSQERLRTPTVRLWSESHVEADVTGVDKLELIVEDAGDGAWDDEGNWLSPKLWR